LLLRRSRRQTLSGRQGEEARAEERAREEEEREEREWVRRLLEDPGAASAERLQWLGSSEGPFRPDSLGQEVTGRMGEL
jgi:hypothetical protein